MYFADAGSGSVTKMLVRVLILIVAITSTKGFPSPNSDQDGEIGLYFLFYLLIFDILIFM